MRKLLMGLACLVSLVAAAQTHAARSRTPKVHRPDSIPAVRALPALGRDGVRLVASPSLGGRTMVLQIRKRPDGRGDGLVLFLSGHPQSGWGEVGRMPFGLSAEDYAALLRDLDADLAADRAAAIAPVAADALMICTDGTGYRLFVHRNGKVLAETSGGCGRPAFDQAVARLRTLIAAQAGAFVR